MCRDDKLQLANIVLSLGKEQLGLNYTNLKDQVDSWMSLQLLAEKLRACVLEMSFRIHVRSRRRECTPWPEIVRKLLKPEMFKKVFTTDPWTNTR